MRNWILIEHCKFTELIDSGLLIVNDMGRAKQYCLFLSVLVIYVCLMREKNLTLKTCAPAFPARSMTKLYAKIKGARAISLFDFPKTWQVCNSQIFKTILPVCQYLSIQRQIHSIYKRKW